MNVLDNAMKNATPADEAANTAPQSNITGAFRTAAQANCAASAALLPDMSFFIGPWTPRDSDQNLIDATFNVFLVPTLFTQGPALYSDVEEKIRHRPTLFGFQTAPEMLVSEPVEILKAGGYNGGWFLPPYDLFTGTRLGCDIVSGPSLITGFSEGALSGIFAFDKKNPLANAHFFWSSTSPRGKNEKYVFNLYNGSHCCLAPANRQFNSLVVRLELI